MELEELSLESDGPDWGAYGEAGYVLSLWISLIPEFLGMMGLCARRCLRTSLMISSRGQ